ncbi:MAG: pyridoxal phosphate-dependent aminotransferase [Candidatus Eremiobacteraeota bacterium]|nr:pyridoxal phosphate-dependent aminotransferase [Candidatus Eremiobacteraeota bacterium]
MLATTIPTSAAAGRLGAEGAFETLARVRELQAQGRDIVSLFVGEPDFDTPEHVKRAGIAGIEANQTHYTPSAGIAPFREAIASYASRFRGIAPAFGADEVVVSPGLKPMIWNVLCSLVDPGDEVVFADPAYPAYASCSAYLQAQPVRIPLYERYGFRLDLDELAAAVSDRTKVLILNSPHNPTGGVLTRADLETIAELAIRHDFTVVSDEIYCRNVYDADFFSIAAVPGMRERTVVLDGFSKAYAMTGWRLGYAIMPASLARVVALMGQNTYSCTATFVQSAGIAALEGPDEPVLAMVNEFRRRRDRIVAGLNALPGISCVVPPGAFYVFPNVTRITGDDRALASYLLEEAGVAALGGSSFGPAGAGYLRMSYATAMPLIEAALARMAQALPGFRP